jgi:cell wall-associated NlpC family hydrolase
MPLKKRISFALAACFAATLLASTNAFAQSTDSSDAMRPRRTSVTSAANGTPTLSTDPVIISVAEDADAEEAPRAKQPSNFDLLSLVAPTTTTHFDGMLLAAIDTRIGAPYVWGASGPRTFDCSGFVWSVFHSAGIDFERSNARTLWARFTPVSGMETRRFGTLVFFNNLQHVGIVADDRGFYHASRSQGVTYSTFDGYWGERIDGFRSINAIPVAD